MLPFIASIYKELLLLKRDRSGLLVLFVMPAALVLIMTLVQENALKTIGEGQSSILFLNKDQGAIGHQIETALASAEGVTLVQSIQGRIPDETAAIQAVSKGDFQVCLIVPAGLTKAVRTQARRSVRQALSMPTAIVATPPGPTHLQIYFDPTVLGGFRSAVQHLIGFMLLGIEVQEKISALSDVLPSKIEAQLEGYAGAMASELSAAIAPALSIEWDTTPILSLKEATARQTMPNSVQHNVPAWSLFGVFFIVLPMAGSFIKERLCGAQQRMLVMPVSYLTIAAGKMSAYLIVCLVQFSLIVCIGKYLLPILGSPQFELGPSPLAVVIVALSAALAATGYGILLGTVISSYEQASMFGPISIVLAAAVGGIMVPLYAMPNFFQRLSMISPLAWGQNAFQELFVRGGQLQSVGTEIACLLGFALLCIGLSWWWFTNRLQRGV